MNNRPLKYSKVSKRDKNKLLHLVFLQGYSVKQAASLIAINYSTAKTVLFFYRKNNRRPKLSIKSLQAIHQSPNQITIASYRQISCETQSEFSDSPKILSSKQIMIVNSVGGIQDYTLTKKQALIMPSQQHSSNKIIINH